MPVDWTQQDEDFLQQARREARAIKTKPLPGTLSLAWGHPGVLAHSIDSPREWENDQREEYLLNRLNERFPRGRGLPGPIGDRLLQHQSGKLPDIKTPYHRGVPLDTSDLLSTGASFASAYLAPGQPLYNVTQGMAATPAIAYNTSSMLANAVDPAAPFDKDASKKMASSVETLGLGIPSALGLVPKGTPTFADTSEDARYARGSASFDDGLRDWSASNAAAEQARKISELTADGRSHHMRLGMPSTAAWFTGAASDAVLDPYGEWLNAVRLARAGKPALRSLLTEWGLGQGAVSLGAGAEAMTPSQ